MKVSREEIEELTQTDQGLATLLVLQGADEDLGTHVVCDRPITLGRDTEVELALRDDSISWRHCRIDRDEEGGRYLLRDLGSTNGTWVNGALVSGPVALAEGDKVFLGATVVRFIHADRFDFEYQARLESLVGTDALTGLCSKRRFDRNYALAVGQALSSGEPLSVLIMDIDSLKQINDTHGHEMGGYAIVEVARLTRDVLEGQGEICRFGGDEFIAFLPGSDKTAAHGLGERIRDAVARHVFEQNGVRVAPTVSIGVATLPDDGKETQELFRAADRALYRAKAAGRNHVAV